MLSLKQNGILFDRPVCIDEVFLFAKHELDVIL